MRKIVRLLFLPLVAIAISCQQGADADTVEMTIASTQVDCVGVGPQKCLLVKEGSESDWTFFYSTIEGFEYEQGYEYLLKVKITKEDTENLPADKSSITYTLVEVVSKTEKDSDNLPEVVSEADTDQVISWTGRILELTEESIGRGAAEGEAIVYIAEVLVTSSNTPNFKEGDTIHSELSKVLSIVPEKEREYAFKSKSLHPAHAKGIYSLETELMDLVR